jgi:RNA polymerase sigma factor (sigma-70 family)
VTDFLGRLQALVEQGTVARALFPCHLPCRRLVTLEDFCQEVLLRALKYAGSFQGQGDAELVGWLKAIGRKVMLTTLQRSRLQALAPLPAEVADPSPNSPLDLLAEEEDRRRRLTWLLRVFAGLKPEEQELLRRHYYERQSFADIGRELGLAPNTLAQRHARLLQRLRRMRGD